MGGIFPIINKIETFFWAVWVCLLVTKMRGEEHVLAILSKKLVYLLRNIVHNISNQYLNRKYRCYIF